MRAGPTILQQLRDWVCLIEAESSRSTHVVGPPNRDGSRDWGLFQINDRYWCRTGNAAGKGCKVKCSDLLNDNISKAAMCAKLIYRHHEFSAWTGWINKCEGRTLPDISGC